MIEKTITYRVLEAFFDRPTKKFQIRELCRLLGISIPSVRKAVMELRKEELVEKIEEGTYPSYRARRGPRYAFYRSVDMIRKLHETGLIDDIVEKTAPDVVILFGSASRGEDTEESDVDLLVVAKEAEIRTERAEKALKRRVHILFDPRPEKMPKELLNNVINGKIVYGYLKVFR